MDHPGDVGETLAWTRGQRLFGPLCGGMAEELRHRLALDSGRSPDLLIKLLIKPKASHIITVSHLCSYVIQIARRISDPTLVAEQFAACAVPTVTFAVGLGGCSVCPSAHSLGEESARLGDTVSAGDRLRARSAMEGLEMA
jgi:hypothetical protein